MDLTYNLPSIRAAIEISRSNRSGAITALQPAARFDYETRLADTVSHVPRGLAYLKLAEADKAQAEFQKIDDYQG